MVAPRDVGMRAQASFEIVLSDAAEQRIVRITLGAMRLGCKFRWKLQERHGCIEACAQEEGDGDTLDAGWGRYDAMESRAQIPIGGELQQLSNVDYECSGKGRDVDPAARRLDLQAFYLILQEQRQQTRIFMGAHALVASSGVASRIADELDEVMRLVPIER